MILNFVINSILLLLGVNTIFFMLGMVIDKLNNKNKYSNDKEVLRFFVSLFLFVFLLTPAGYLFYIILKWLINPDFIISFIENLMKIRLYFISAINLDDIFLSNLFDTVILSLSFKGYLVALNKVFFWAFKVGGESKNKSIKYLNRIVIVFLLILIIAVYNNINIKNVDFINMYYQFSFVLILLLSNDVIKELKMKK